MGVGKQTKRGAALVLCVIFAFVSPAHAAPGDLLTVDGHSRNCTQALMDAYEDAYDECDTEMVEICSQSQGTTNGVTIGGGGFAVNIGGHQCVVELTVRCLDNDTPLGCSQQAVEFEF